MSDSIDCTTARGMLAELVATDAWPTGEIARHLSACPACTAEYRELRAAWEGLPLLAAVAPPVSVRRRVLAYARRMARARSLAGELWAAVRDLALPVGWGTLAALLMVALLHLRGAVAPVGTAGVATASLALSAVLALVVGGLTRGDAQRPVHTVLLGAAGGLGGYVVLSLAVPLPAAFQLCRVALFGEAAMSLAQVCLIYLVVAAAYAAIPLAVAAYVASGTEARWGTGLAEGLVFAVLAAPVLVLQAGLDELMITGTVVIGLVAGSLLGGLGGTWARSRASPRP